MIICAEFDGRSWATCTRGIGSCVCGTDDPHRAAMILDVFNRWRTEQPMPNGLEAQMPHPAAITGAINTAIAHLRKIEEGQP